MITAAIAFRRAGNALQGDSFGIEGSATHCWDSLRFYGYARLSRDNTGNELLDTVCGGPGLLKSRMAGNQNVRVRDLPHLDAENTVGDAVASFGPGMRIEFSTDSSV